MTPGSDRPDRLARALQHAAQLAAAARVDPRALTPAQRRVSAAYAGCAFVVAEAATRAWTPEQD